MIASVDTLADILVQQYLHRPNAPAIIYWQRSVSFKELYLGALCCANALSSTTNPGDRIAVLSGNNPAYVELLYAAPMAGRTLTPLNTRLDAREIWRQIDLVDASLLFIDPPMRSKLELADVDADTANEELVSPLSGRTIRSSSLPGYCESATVADPTRKENIAIAQLPDSDLEAPAWLLFTSGTTARARAAILTERSLLAGLESGAIGRPVSENDRYLYPFPLFHVAAHNVLLQHRYGACVVLLRSFDAATALKHMTTDGVTSMSLAPTMIAMLLDHPNCSREVFSNIHTIGYGSAAIAPPLLKQLQQTTKAGLSQGYGMTELSGTIAFLGPDDHRHALINPAVSKLHTVGKPLSTIDLRILDSEGRQLGIGQSGEIVVRGAQCFSGYWGNPEETDKAFVDGWFKTGDLGAIDDDGYLQVIDRVKDIVISGGENIAAREVENALLEHSAVDQAAVIGTADDQWGEVVTAIVVPRERATSASHTDEKQWLAELETHCRKRLAGFKVPRRWQLAKSLPHNATGKIDKPTLRKRYAADTTDNP